MSVTGERTVGLSPEAAWELILRLRDQRAGADGTGLVRARPAASDATATATASFGVTRQADGRWCVRGRPVSQPVQDLFDLYLPLCALGATRSFVVGHLGQSLDGRIATASGVSRFITGRENIVHLHRMRALADAVVVGAETVRQDDPLLTTRLVRGRNPVRVVLDPRRRLEPHLQVFTDDAAKTLLVCDEAHAGERVDRGGPPPIGVPSREGRLDLGVLCRRLLDRGLGLLFVEGGGVTVSSFLKQGVLNRLQVAIAPVILGSGRPGISLPPIARLEDALRLRTRTYPMGEDVLFDCEVGSHPGG
jgi:riboflavin-specific deaminase-like protein